MESPRRPSSRAAGGNPAITLWISLSAVFSAGGWLLSWCGQLNVRGYGVLLLVAGGVAAWWWRSARASGIAAAAWSGARLCRRFGRPLPLVFLALAALACLGGVLHPPNMHDAMTYRVPRMLHWLADNRWHWIETANQRMNTRSCGFEWLAMPLLVFTKSDRGFFLLNTISFLLLPGLVYSLFSRLGVRQRVAWCWMWFLPTGYSFLLQAGGSANDLFAVPYVLAAVDFALRARQTGRGSCLGWSLLAAGLATGAKATNLPLLLPWLLAWLPSWRLAVTRLGSLAAVGLLALVASFAPTAILNTLHCGDWSGAVLEPGLAKGAPWEGLLGNGLLLLAHNFVFPFFPWASWWNETIPHLLPVGLRTILDSSLENEWWRLAEAQVEDSAATGFGVAVVFVLSLGWVALQRFKGKALPARAAQEGFRPSAVPVGQGGLVAWSTWISLLAYMLKASLTAVGRVVAPYVPLLLASLLRSPRQEQLVRRRWWQRLVLGAGVLAFLVLVVNPARPLWPAQAVLGWLAQSRPANRLLARARIVYSVYAQRHDALAPVRSLLPPETQRVGALLSLDDPETSLWRPFGSRCVVQVPASDTPEAIRKRGLEYLVISPRLTEWSGLTLEDWLKGHQAELVGQVSLRLYASQEKAQVWSVARLR
jgi:hypothetical protein